MLGSMSVHAGKSDLINGINGIAIGDPGVNGNLRVLPTVNKITLDDGLNDGNLRVLPTVNKITLDDSTINGRLNGFAIKEQGVKMAIKEQGMPKKMAIKEQGIPQRKEETNEANSQKSFLPSNFRIKFRTLPTPPLNEANSQKSFLPSNFRINFRTLPTPPPITITPLPPFRAVNNPGVKRIADGREVQINESGVNRNGIGHAVVIKEVEMNGRSIPENSIESISVQGNNIDTLNNLIR